MNSRPSFLVPILAPLGMALACGGGSVTPGDHSVDLGTHRLHAVVAGSGTPVVVIDGGIGAGSAEYQALAERIASRTTVVAYDRAGYGSSTPGPLPRDSRREVDELRTLLGHLGVPGPFLVVGHSLGGLNAQVFAADHPGEIAGLVLLDPPPMGFILGKDFPQLSELAERMTAEWQRSADRGRHAEDRAERTRAGFLEMLASEHREMFGSSAALAAGIESFGNLPVVVVASGVPNSAFGDVAAEYQRYWADQSRALAGKSSQGTFVFAETSTHALHADAEDLVADRVLQLVSSIRNGSP